MKNIINKLFGNKTADNTITDDPQKIMSEIETLPIGISEENVLYGGVVELGGFFLLNSVVIGRFKAKTKNGATLNLTGPNLDLELKSDMDELETELSSVKGRYISNIDFQIDEKDLKFFESPEIEKFVLKIAGENIVFTAFKKDFQKVISETSEEE